MATRMTHRGCDRDDEAPGGDGEPKVAEPAVSIGLLHEQTSWLGDDASGYDLAHSPVRVGVHREPQCEDHDREGVHPPRGGAYPPSHAPAPTGNRAPTNRRRSTQRDEYPHSLSYQPDTF